MSSGKMAFALVAAALVLAIHGVDARSCSETYQDDNRGFGTRLHKTARSADALCAKEFLDAGDDPNQNDRFGLIPLHEAAKVGVKSVVQVLIDYGSEINRLSPAGTPLLLAACNGNGFVAQLLIDSGADKTIRNEDGDLPSDKICQCDRALKCEERPLIVAALDGTGSQPPKKPGCAEGLIPNYDFPSKDGIINDGKNTITKSAEECCQKCASREDCMVWTRITKTTQGGSNEGECWLRKYVPEGRYCATCESGLSACSGTLYMDNTDYPSDDGIIAGGANMITASKAECCNLCNARKDCKSWTRIKVDHVYNKKGECWLRNYIPERKKCTACESGSKP